MGRAAIQQRISTLIHKVFLQWGITHTFSHWIYLSVSREPREPKKKRTNCKFFSLYMTIFLFIISVMGLFNYRLLKILFLVIVKTVVPQCSFLLLLTFKVSDKTIKYYTILIYLYKIYLYIIYFQRPSYGFRAQEWRQFIINQYLKKPSGWILLLY